LAASHLKSFVFPQNETRIPAPLFAEGGPQPLSILIRVLLLFLRDVFLCLLSGESIGTLPFAARKKSLAGRENSSGSR